MHTHPASGSLPGSAPIPQRTIDGDETIALGEVVLVASKSQPGFWYPVVDGHCPCDGYRYRHTCRHIERARLALGGDEETPNIGTPYESAGKPESPAPSLCRRCQKRPVNPKFSQTLCTRCVGWLDGE